MDRYSVRPYRGRYNVWDAATNGWIGPTPLNAEKATAMATRRELANRGPAGPEERVVEPSRAVDVHEDGQWIYAGNLDLWRRHDGEWWGRVVCPSSGRERWYPASKITLVDL